MLSVLGAGKGAAPVPLDDLDLRRGFSLKAAGDAATQYNDLMAEVRGPKAWKEPAAPGLLTLCLPACVLAHTQEFSRRHPSVAFVSSYPGTVRTPIFDSLPWYARGPLKLLAPLLAKSPEVWWKDRAHSTDEKWKTSSNIPSLPTDSLTLIPRQQDCGHFMTYALAAPEYSKGWSLVGEAGEAVNKTRYCYYYYYHYYYCFFYYYYYLV